MILSGIAAGAASTGIVAWNNHVGPSTTTPLGLRIAGVLAGLVVIAALAVSLATLIPWSTDSASPLGLRGSWASSP